MNRIYKTIWSKTKQCYIVVPETAKSTTRNKAKIGAAILAAATVAVVGVGGVQADNTFADGYGVAASTGDKPTGGKLGTEGATLSAGSISIGGNVINAKASGTYLPSVVIGQYGNSQTTGGSVTIGTNASSGIRFQDNVTGALTHDSTSITSADGKVTVTRSGSSSDMLITGTVGSNAYDKQSYNALDDSAKREVIALFASNRSLSNTDFFNALRDKVNVRVTDRNGQSVAIGSNALAVGDQSIAIGNDLIAGHNSIVIGGDDYDIARNNFGAAFQSATGVALSGSYSPASARDGGITIGSKSNGYSPFATVIGMASSVGTNSIAASALGSGSVVGNDSEASLAAGGGSYVYGKYSTALGAGAGVGVQNANNPFTTGTSPVEKAVAIGTHAKATLENSVAIGSNALTDHKARKVLGTTINGTSYAWAGAGSLEAGDVFSVGAKGDERQIINVAPGRVDATSTDAINGSQLYAVTYKLGSLFTTSITNPDGTSSPLVTDKDANGNEVYYPKNADGTVDKTKPYYAVADANGETKFYPADQLEKNPDGSIKRNDLTNEPTPIADAKPATTAETASIGSMTNGTVTSPALMKSADNKDLIPVTGTDGTTKYYTADQLDPATGQPKAGETAADTSTATPLKLANDGKWYKATDVNPNGTAKDGVTAVTKPATTGSAGLVDFSKSSPTAAATVGDLQNLGWVVSSDKTTGNLGTAYSDQVKNAHEVQFVGTNAAVVSGATNDKGVRVITVDVNTDSITDAIMPTTVKNPDGTTSKLVQGTDGAFYPADANGAADTTKPGYKQVDGKWYPADQVNTDPQGVNTLKDANTAKPAANVGKTLDGLNNGTTTSDAPAATTADGKALTPVTGDDGTTKYYTADQLGTDGKPKADQADKGLVKATDGKYYAPDQVTANPAGADGKVTYTPNAGATATETTPLKLANDGKWYNAADVNPNGTPVAGKTAVEKPATVGTAGLADFSKSDPTAAATVGDLQNLGWVVSSDKTTGNLGTAYSDQVKNAHEVQFVGTNAAVVSGATNDKGVRVITVDVNTDSITDAIMPTTVKNADGTTSKLVKGDDGAFYPAKDDGTADTTKPGYKQVDGKWYPADQVNTDPAGVNTLKDANTAKPADNVGKTLDGLNNGTTTSDGPAATTADGKALTPVTGDDGTTKYYTADQLGTDGKPKADQADKGLVKATDGKYYAPDQVTANPAGADGKVTYTPNAGATATETTPLKLANDGKWYNAADVNPNGTPVAGKTAVEKPATVGTAGLADFSKSDPTAAATVGDLQNLGWVVSSDKTTGNLGTAYSDQVKNAHEVQFVGTNAAVVSGATNDKGVRVITVDVNTDSITDAIMPTTVKNADGTTSKLVQGTDGAFYPAKDDGTADTTKPGYKQVDGKWYPADQVNTDQAGVNTLKDANTAKPADNVGKTLDGLNNGTTTSDGPAATTADGKALTPVTGEDGTTKYYTADQLGKDGKPLADQADKGLVKATDGKYYAPDQVTANPAGADGKVTYTPNNGATATETTPLKLANDGKWYNAADVNPNGTTRDGATAVTKPATTGTAGLADFSKSDPTAAATVGDLQNLGWVVSSDNTLTDAKTGTANVGAAYSDQVRNAHEVRFTGTGAAIVSGMTDENGVRIINVDVNAEAINNAINPSAITNADGSKTPLVKGDDGAYYPADKDGKADTTKPGYKQVGDKWYPADQVETDPATGVNTLKDANTAKPADNVGKNLTGLGNGTTTSEGPIQTADGKDLVPVTGDDGTTKYYTKDQLDENGKPKADQADKGLIKATDGKLYTPDQVTANPADANGKVTYTPNAGATATDANPLKLANDGKWYKASDVNPNGTTVPGATAQEKPATVGTAGLADFSKSDPTAAATVGDLQNLGWVVSSDKTTGNLNTAYSDQVKNAHEVKFVGTGLATVSGATTVVDDKGVRVITVDVDAKTVTEAIMPTAVKNGDGTSTKLVKDPETGTYYPAKEDGTPDKGTTDKPITGYKDVDGKLYPADQVNTDATTGVNTLADPAKATAVDTGKSLTGLVNGAATSAAPMVNGDNQPLTAVTGDDGSTQYYTADQLDNGKPKADAVATDAKDASPIALANDGKWYKASDVNPNGSVKDAATAVEKPANVGNAGLADLGKSDATAAATVGDLKNLGFVVSTNDDEYSDQVKNGHRVDFTGENGITVKGETDKDGVRRITVSLAKGDVVAADDDKTGTTTDASGNKVDVVKADDGKWYPKADTTTDKDGKVTKNDNAKEVTTPVNTAGQGFVTGNDVAKAIDDAKTNFGAADKAPDDAKEVTGTTKNGTMKFASNDALKFKLTEKDGVTYVEGQLSNNPDVGGSTTGEEKDGKEGSLAVKNSKGESAVSLGTDGKDGASGNGMIAVNNKDGKEAVAIKSDDNGVGTITLNGSVDASAGKTADGKDKANTMSLSGNGLSFNPASNVGSDGSAADPTKVVSISATGISAGGQTISNVADGVNPTDAVNKGQMDSAIGKVSDRLNRVGAQGAALSALKPLQFDPAEPSQFMAGYGYYKGTSALALGFAHYANESLMFHAGAAVSGGTHDMMANAGVTWKFGQGEGEATLAKAYRQGPISSVTVLQDQVASLEAKNAAQASEIEAQRDEIQSQRAEINDLRTKLDAVMNALHL